MLTSEKEDSLKRMKDSTKEVHSLRRQTEVIANCNNLLCEGWHHPTGGQTNDPSAGGGGASGVHIISSGPHSCKKYVGTTLIALQAFLSSN